MRRLIIYQIVLPLDDRYKMEPMPGIEPESIAYQAITLPLSYIDKMVGTLRLELRMIASL